MQIKVGNEIKNVLWAPNPGPQTEFCQTTADYALYGGARGGGKTDALLAEATRWNQFPDYKCLFLRKTFPQLSEVMERAFKLYPQLGLKWEGERRLWRAYSGAFIQFGHCENEKDKYNYIGKEFHRIIYDQVERFTESQFQEINTTLRTTNPNIPTQVLASANPGGVGHGWVKNRWIKKCRPIPNGNKIYNADFNIWWQPLKAGQPYKDEFNQIWQYYPALVFQNPQVMDNDRKYVNKLLALKYEKREAYLWGNWDVFLGQFFQEWRDEIHVLRKKDVPKVPMHWDVLGACDYASSGWYFSLVAAITHNAEIIILEEDYFLGGSIRKKAYRAQRLIEKYPQMKRWACPWDMFNETRDKDTEQVVGRIIDRFVKHIDKDCRKRVRFVKASKDRVAGWDLIRDGLSWSDGDKPWLYVMGDCRKLIETIPEQCYQDQESEDENIIDKEDLDKEGWTHGVDALRYLCMVAKREKKKIPTDVYDAPEKARQQQTQPNHWLLS